MSAQWTPGPWKLRLILTNDARVRPLCVVVRVVVVIADADEQPELTPPADVHIHWHRRGLPGENAAIEQLRSLRPDLELSAALAIGFVVDADVGSKPAASLRQPITNQRRTVHAQALVVGVATQA